MKKSTLLLFLLQISAWLSAQPVAIDDYTETIQGALCTLITIDVLANDLAPAGQSLRIKEITQTQHGIAEITSANAISYKTGTLSGYFGSDSLQYRVCLVSDSTVISNWATVRINILPDSLHPVTNPDYGEACLGLWETFDVLANDNSFNGESFTLSIGNYEEVYNLAAISFDATVPGRPKIKIQPTFPDTVIKVEYRARYNNSSIVYAVTDTLFVSVKKGHAVEKFNANNICVYVNADALLFGNPYVSGVFNQSGNSTCYEIPKGSGKGTFFTMSPWIGGKDASDSIHLAAERYRQNGQDFRAGPVSSPAAYALQPDSVTHRVYFIRQSDIQYHLRHYTNANYTPIWPIAAWPGNGDTTLGQAWQLAPFVDLNNNGKYEPWQGDCPRIRGDASAFFIINDHRNTHTETDGLPLGAELHCMVYAFDRPDDSLFNNTLFIHYDIYNRSQNQYDSTWFGFWSDMDLGVADDDLTGCDVTNSFYYAYNNDSIDGTGQSWGYGSNPPIQSVAFLAGPTMDFDQTDNPKYDNTGNLLCGEGINGVGFGDGIIDNERFGMTRSFYNRPKGDFIEIEPKHWYNILKGLWYFGEPLSYGGFGHISLGGVGPDAKYLFPGDTDPLNWGTWCLPPNDGYNQNGKYWTAQTIYNSLLTDVQNLGSTGPFTFKPGDCQQIDLALVTTWNTANPDPLASFGKMQQYVATLHTCFERDSVPGGGTFSGNDVGIENHQQENKADLNVFPNPASGSVTFSLSHVSSTPALITITDIAGRIIHRQTFTEQQWTWNAANEPNGFYLYTLRVDNTVSTGKLVINH